MCTFFHSQAPLIFVVLVIFIQQKHHFFCFEFEILGEQPRWLVLYQRRDVFHFMTSLTQIAGHKMSALTVLFLQLSNVDF